MTEHTPAVKVHNPGIEKRLVSEPRYRPGHFRYGHCNPAGTVYELTGVKGMEFL